MVWPFSSKSGLTGPLRREPASVRILRVFLRFLWVSSVILLVVGAYYSYGYVHRFVYSSGYFKIEDVRISGASPVLEKELNEWLGQQLSRSGHNLCLVDEKKLAAKLSFQPRIKTAHVRKVYPQMLRIDVTERTPLMVVVLDQPFLIDEEGVIIAKAGSDVLRQMTYPVLTGVLGSNYDGPGDRLKQARVADVLAAVSFMREHDSSLQKKIVEWNLNGREEITAILASHTEVRFGDHAPLELLDKLSSALAMKRELEKATYIDLRMERQIVYK